MGIDIHFNVRSPGDPLDNVTHLRDAHSARGTFGHKQSNICILAAPQIPLKPDRALNGEVHLSLLISFTANDDGPAFPIDRVTIQSVYLADPAAGGIQDLNQSVLERRHTRFAQGLDVFF